jgi:hypothetical protein
VAAPGRSRWPPGWTWSSWRASERAAWTSCTWWTRWSGCTRTGWRPSGAASPVTSRAGSTATWRRRSRPGASGRSRSCRSSASTGRGSGRAPWSRARPSTARPRSRAPRRPAGRPRAGMDAGVAAGPAEPPPGAARVLRDLAPGRHAEAGLAQRAGRAHLRAGRPGGPRVRQVGAPRRGRPGRRAGAARLGARPYPCARGGGRGRDADGSWLVTSALPGTNAVHPRWLADPRPAVEAVGRGLRALHDTLPVQECPWDWRAEDRVADARRRSAAGQVRPGGWHPGPRPPVPGGRAGRRSPSRPRWTGSWSATATPAPRTPSSRGRDVVGPRRPGGARRGRPVGGPRRRDLVDGLELRPRLGDDAAGRLRRGPGPSPDRYYRLLWDLGPTGSAHRPSETDAHHPA